METGTYVPVVALKLAQVLEVTVEDLFRRKPSKSRITRRSWNYCPGTRTLSRDYARGGHRLVAGPAGAATRACRRPTPSLRKVGKRPGRGRVQLFQEEKQYLVRGC